MIELKTLTDAARKRYSCRTYQRDVIDSDRREKMASFLNHLTAGPLGSKARFTIASASEADRSALKGLHTYGFIKNPTAFILGAVPEARFNLEDFGYLMELAILYAAHLGLGTCWLGGTFTYSRFARIMKLKTNETMPAVAASGLPSERHLTDRLIRGQAQSDRRKSWEILFFDGRFDRPLSQHTAGLYASSLELVRIGPSASNKQPWRILRDADNWHFYLQRTPNYPPRIPRLLDIHLADLQRVDMGIAMCHFAVGAAEAGLHGIWQENNPGLNLPEHTEYVISWQGKPSNMHNV